MKKIILLILLFGVLVTVQSAFALKIPKLIGRVNDYATVLTSDQKASFNNLLKEVETANSAQVVLLTINSLEGENLEDFSMTVAEKWKLGQKNKDNGVLLLIVVKDKKIRIEVGYGLEGVLTDLKCGYIIRQLIVPDFKKRNFYEGINEGLTAITGLITKKYEISSEQLKNFEKISSTEKKQNAISVITIFIIMIFSFLLKGRNRRGYRNTSFWFGASGGRGGFGGGGFSGGGGSFGGGGASGGW